MRIFAIHKHKMLENLIYCLNATMPIFSLMVIGYIFKRLNILKEQFTKELNSFVFKFALPVLVFKELSLSTFQETWDTGFVLFCFLGTVFSIALLLIFVAVFKHISDPAEFIQGSFRSSAALLGVGIVESLYGNAGCVPLMIVGAVPLYNVTAVVLLTMMKREGESQKISRETLLKALTGIIRNPIIIGVFAGFLWSILKIPSPEIFKRTITHIGNTATPLGLMALGASLNFKSVGNRIKEVAFGTFMKLFGFCMLLLPVAIAFGYTKEKLLAVLIMLGSPTTVSSFVMAKSMGHDGQLSGGIVMFSTLFSAFSLTLWLFVLKTMSYI